MLILQVRFKNILYYSIAMVCLISIACKQSSDTTVPALASAAEISPPDSPMLYQLTYTTDYLMGKFVPKDDASFVQIDNRYADRGGMVMRAEAYADYVRMYEAAARDGIDLIIRSATRNHDYQKGIWERKWTGATILSDGTNAAVDISDDTSRARKILQYSSMPGTSRHHWGTDIDLNAFNNAYFDTGDGLAVYQWLSNHAEAYGFAQPYTTKGADRPQGYEEEKWHWSYLPLSTTMTHDASQILRDTMISGFLGAHTAPAIGVVDNYILGIHKTCKGWH